MVNKVFGVNMAFKVWSHSDSLWQKNRKVIPMKNNFFKPVWFAKKRGENKSGWRSEKFCLNEGNLKVWYQLYSFYLI